LCIVEAIGDHQRVRAIGRDGKVPAVEIVGVEKQELRAAAIVDIDARAEERIGIGPEQAQQKGVARLSGQRVNTVAQNPIYVSIHQRGGRRERLEALARAIEKSCVDGISAGAPSSGPDTNTEYRRWREK
jgi:hypothetical protein